MESIYKPLGELAERVDERNRDGAVTTLLGVSIDKCFMPSVANVIGTDLTKYKIIRHDEFAVSLMQVSRDEKIPVACLKDYDIAIMSPAYSIFRVKAGADVLPDYLALWFARKEFDREATFIAVGGVRGSMSWEDFARMQILVPPIDVQRKLVYDYKVISDRIALKRRIDRNLEAQVQTMFDNLFMKQQPDGQLQDIAEINPNRKLSKNCVAQCFDMATLPTVGCIPVGGVKKAYNGGMRFMNGDIILARITPCLENGKAAYINILANDEVAFGSTEYIVLSPKPSLPSSFLYFLVRNSEFITFAIKHMNGSSGRQRVSGDNLAAFPIKMPQKDALEEFDKFASRVLSQMRLSSMEIQKLSEVRRMIMARLSHC